MPNARNSLDQMPNPGSDKAITLGCACPVLDNGHGRGYLGQAGVFVMNAECPIHGTQDPFTNHEQE